MNRKIGMLSLALLIGMAGIATPTMAEEWISGVIPGIDVYYQDIAKWQAWKTTNTDCNTPQCGQDGGQDGDNLVDPLTIDPQTNLPVNFSKYPEIYPAQVGCIEVGGRLPTKDELTQIYNNRTKLGNNFTHLYYWSSTEYNTKMAYYQAFRSGRQSWADKDTRRYMRCVRTVPPSTS